MDTNLARAAMKRATPTLALLVMYAPTKLPKNKLNKEAIRWFRALLEALCNLASARRSIQVDVDIDVSSDLENPRVTTN